MNTTITVEETDLKKVYCAADEDGKKVLAELFGDQVLNRISSRVRSFEEACVQLGHSAEFVLQGVSPVDDKAIVAFLKLFVIVRALNGGWVPDWNNTDEYKYYPWWDLQKSKTNPSGFRLDLVCDICSHSTVGSRLCYKSRELAEYAAETFLDLYRDLMVL